MAPLSSICFYSRDTISPCWRMCLEKINSIQKQHIDRLSVTWALTSKLQNMAQMITMSPPRIAITAPQSHMFMVCVCVCECACLQSKQRYQAASQTVTYERIMTSHTSETGRLLTVNKDSELLLNSADSPLQILQHRHLEKRYYKVWNGIGETT